MSATTANIPGTIVVPISNITATPVFGPVYHISAQSGKIVEVSPGIPAMYILVNAKVDGGGKPHPGETFELTCNGSPAAVAVVFSRQLDNNLEFTAKR